MNIKNSAGSTPLHKAAISGHLGVAKLLIENGADTELLNDAQKRAEDYANNKEIRMILKGDRLQTKEISVPKDKHGLIIGRGGSTLKRISRDTGVEINVPKQQNKKDTITLSGDEDEIAKAEAIIMKMLKREGLKSKPSLADIPEGWTASEIIIDPRKYGLIIGPKGRTIQNIIDKTGANVYVPPPDSDEKVIVKGPDEAVHAAVRMIYESTEGYRNNQQQQRRDWVDYEYED